MSEVYLIIGSNQGDRETKLRNAVKLISERVGNIVNSSSVYETEAWGFDSDPFWNQVLVVDTQISPFEVLSTVLTIETELGRVRDNADTYTARLIDIDILFYEDEIINEPDLVVPHPLIGERRFVLEPLSEINPGLKHPVTKKIISQMLEECEDKSAVIKLKIEN